MIDTTMIAGKSLDHWFNSTIEIMFYIVMIAMVGIMFFKMIKTMWEDRHD